MRKWRFDRRRVRLTRLTAALVMVLTLLPAWLIMPAPVAAQETQADSANPNVVILNEVTGEQGVTASIQIFATKDSYIASGFPNNNFGGLPNLNIGWDGGGANAMRLLVQFDVSVIPKGAVIDSAQFYAYQQTINPPGDGSMNFRAQYLTQGWNESGVTWNNANYLGGQSLPLGDIPSTIGWVSGGATDVVRAWVSGSQANNGLMLTGDETPSLNRWRAFRSREAGSGPYLIVNYEVNCDTVPPQASVNPLPPYSTGEFVVTWGGTDYAPAGCKPSGIRNYDVEYRINGGSWQQWKQQTTATSNTFKDYAPDGALVEFRARATDNAGNAQSWGGTQASTRIDDSPPQVTVQPLPQFTTETFFQIFWSGTDSGSGIAYYDVEFEDQPIDGAESGWQPLVEGTTQTSYQLTGAQPFTAYGFRARGVDNVGNVQAWSPSYQAATFVFPYPVAVVTSVDPLIVKPTSVPTDSFTVSWQGFSTSPGTLTYRIYYNYQSQGWKQWKPDAYPDGVFPAAVTSYVFPYFSMGLRDGVYEFSALAESTQGKKPDSDLKTERIAIVDLADVYQEAFLPLITSK